MVQSKKLYKKNNIFWNSGIFLFKSSTILQESEKFCPSIIAKVKHAKENQKIDYEYNVLNSKKFREIYNETFWNGSNFRVSFETGKLILINDIPGLNMECGYLLEGTYDSDWDGCTYNPVTTVVITENSNSFIYREKIGDGKCNTPGCSYQCGASGEVEYTFQVLTENAIEFNMKVLNSDESYKSTLIKTDNSFSTNNCSRTNRYIYLQL